jgi:hypothetical protein
MMPAATKTERDQPVVLALSGAPGSVSRCRALSRSFSMRRAAALRYTVVALTPPYAMPTDAKPFTCPTCGAEYKVVRVEAKTMVPEGRLTCTKCGGPLHAREGRHILKYFLVGGSRRHPLRPQSRS